MATARSSTCIDMSVKNIHVWVPVLRCDVWFCTIYPHDPKAMNTGEYSMSSIWLAFNSYVQPTLLWNSAVYQLPGMARRNFPLTLLSFDRLLNDVWQDNKLYTMISPVQVCRPTHYVNCVPLYHPDTVYSLEKKMWCGTKWMHRSIHRSIVSPHFSNGTPKVGHLMYHYDISDSVRLQQYLRRGSLI